MPFNPLTMVLLAIPVVLGIGFQAYLVFEKDKERGYPLRIVPAVIFGLLLTIGVILYFFYQRAYSVSNPLELKYIFLSVLFSVILVLKFYLSPLIAGVGISISIYLAIDHHTYMIKLFMHDFLNLFFDVSEGWMPAVYIISWLTISTCITVADAASSYDVTDIWS